MAELTDEQIAEEEAFLEGLPKLNWGAFFMPGIWGPAHGFWVAILFYPLWVFIDYLIYGAYTDPQPWTIGFAVLSAVILFVITYFFAKVSQPFAAHRAADHNISREQYLKRERIWPIASIIIALAALAWATYYNLDVRTVLK